jgi:uncharacterized protein (DUF2147 family)
MAAIDFSDAKWATLRDYRSLARSRGARLISKIQAVSISIAAALLLVGGVSATAQASGADAGDATDARILGYWQRGEGEAIIEVRRHADGYHGVIVTGGQRPETVGIEVFRDLKFDPESGSWHGRAYSIKRRREVNIDIEVPKADELELTAHILVFKRLVQFKRIPDSDVEGIQLADR